MVVSVTERSQRDLTKRFDETEIDWAIVEKQLVAWEQYFRKGKKLRIGISFNYVETAPQSASGSSKKGDKRGPMSTTQRMLAESYKFRFSILRGQSSASIAGPKKYKMT